MELQLELAGAIEGVKSLRTEQAAGLKELKTETREITEEIKQRLKEIEQRIVPGPWSSEGFSFGGSRDSLSTKLLEGESIQAMLKGESTSAKTQLSASLLTKNTILGEAGSPAEPSSTLVQSDRLPGIVPGAFRTLNLLDFIATGGTTSNLIEYTRELSFANDAAETSEGQQKPESDLVFELVQDPVRTIAHWMKVSRQAFDDSQALAAYLDARLRHGVRAKLQSQIINGTGSSPQMAGITASGRHTAFVPQTGETALDSLNRAKYDVVDADYQPSFILLNPKDFGAIERLKRSATDNVFVGADGLGARYINSGLGGLIWELPTIITPDVALGKFILGSSDALQLFMRQESTVEMTDSDDTDFQKNLLTIRAELRASLAIFTPAALLYGDLTL